MGGRGRVRGGGEGRGRVHKTFLSVKILSGRKVRSLVLSSDTQRESAT